MVNEAGLNYVRSKELLLRWAEASALSDVVFRTHVGNLPNESAQVRNFIVLITSGFLKSLSVCLCH